MKFTIHDYVKCTHCQWWTDDLSYAGRDCLECAKGEMGYRCARCDNMILVSDQYAVVIWSLKDNEMQMAHVGCV